jgi:hypothetical protein
VVLLAAPILYLIAETISALAWRNPHYDYVVNFVSDLGVPAPSARRFTHRSLP